MTIRVLVTGISGVGKSSVITALVAHGYSAIDLDTPDYSQWIAVAVDDSTPGTPVEATRDWVWNEGRLTQLLASEEEPLLFVSGTSANMGKFLNRFDKVILLSASEEVMAYRLRTRTTNDYGKHPEELTRALALKQSVEPLLRRISTHEIDTSRPFDEVVREIVQIATMV